MLRRASPFALALPSVLGLGACVGCASEKSDASGATTPAAPGVLLTGEAAKGDWTTDAPGVRRKLTPADLPPPYATESAANGPRLVPRPEGALPLVPAGFRVQVFAEGLTGPRMLRTAPNGDVFVVESRAGQVRVLRDADGDGSPEASEVFVTGLAQPFGVSFYPPGEPTQWVYVAVSDAVLRFPYADGDLRARGTAEVVVTNLDGSATLPGGGHWTRDVVFSNDGARMWVSVGSRSNVSDDAAEARRARIFEYTPDGKDERVYAAGIRNPVGLAVHPTTGDLWTAVNERDELGDHLVPDYVTRVTDGAFYGWPWFYVGDNQDPRHAGKHPELAGRVALPDVLGQSHSAALGVSFYTGEAFPAEYRGQAFVGFHGSWNRSRRTGYKVVVVPADAGVPRGEYVDFLTGFVTATGEVWGRPVAITQTKEGAILVSDDGGDRVWRVWYTGG